MQLREARTSARAIVRTPLPPPPLRQASARTAQRASTKGVYTTVIVIADKNMAGEMYKCGAAVGDVEQHALHDRHADAYVWHLRGTHHDDISGEHRYAVDGAAVHSGSEAELP